LAQLRLPNPVNPVNSVYRCAEYCPVWRLAGNNGQVTPQTDSELLSNYVATGAESAFAALVERHIGLVYSAALRIVVDPHLAQDVTQTTFAVLAREARHLIAHPVLPSWLHRTASNHAANLVRGEMRRRAREQEAHAMQPQTNEAEAQWKQIAPLLDGAINQLPERDRAVILLRFFGTKSAREIGADLRVSEEAAQKRVTRAVDRLRQIFVRNGVTLSAATLATILAFNATAAVPPGLSLSVTTGALAGGTVVTGFTGFSISTLKLILMSKLKISAICALVVAGVVTPLVIHHQRKANAAGPVVATNATPPPDASATARIPSSPEELQKYHTEVAQTVDMLKQVGMQLRLSMRDNPNGVIDGAQVLEAVGAGVSGRKHVELMVPSSVVELRRTMSRMPETIVARTPDPIRTPEGKWLRVYTLADGSAHQRITDDPAETFEGNWKPTRVK
jgi:RNA polymerase sigma factor (sigma-70 family)